MRTVKDSKAGVMVHVRGRTRDCVGVGILERISASPISEPGKVEMPSGPHLSHPLVFCSYSTHKYA
jgi:hypothetical protein